MPNLEQKPFALFNGYIEIPSRVPYKPDEYSRLQTLAASELLRRGKIETAVFLAGDVPSESNPGSDVYGGIGQRMAAQLRRNLPNLPESAIVLIPVAKSTRAEVRKFRQLAKEKGWTNLMVVGKESHLERVQRAINRIFRRRSKTIRAVSQESILTQFPRYSKIIDAVRDSQEEKAFSKRETLINTIDKLPIIGGLVLDLMNADGVKILESKIHRVLSRKPEDSKKTS